QAEDGIRDRTVTGVQTCALPIYGQRILLPRLAAVHVDDPELVVAGPARFEQDPLTVRTPARMAVLLGGICKRVRLAVLGRSQLRSEERRVGKARGCW